MSERGERTTEGLSRVLGDLDAAALAVGIVVGTGIFAVPGIAAGHLGAPGPILLAWLVGGAIALSGALTHAELAAMLPRQGGSFVYILHAFGPFAAFFKGWGSFLIGYPASLAAIAMVFASYLSSALDLPEGAGKPVALAALSLAFLLNLRGTLFSGRLQTTLTALKVGALGLVAFLALAAGPANWERLSSGSAEGWPGPAAFAAALVGILWTYDGWMNLVVVGGEVVDPRRSLVRGLLIAVGVVTGLYLVVNVAYLVLLPMDELAGNTAVAAAAAERLLGPAGGRLLSSFVVLSAFGALFGILVAAPRYFFAMAREGLFFRGAGHVDADTGAPRRGATLIWGMSALYLLTGTFEQVVGYYVAVSLIYNMLSVAAVYRLRVTRPDWERPFRVPGYPVVPLVFLLGGGWIFASEVWSHPGRGLVGLGLLAASWPAWRLWRRRLSAPPVD